MPCASSEETYNCTHQTRMQEIRPVNRLRQMDASVFVLLFFRADHQPRGMKHKTKQNLLLVQKKGRRNLNKPFDKIKIRDCSRLE